jgi:pyruvate kinase
VARQLALAWGVYPVLCHDVMDVLEMSDWACQTAKKEGLAQVGETIVISAGVPFGTSGTTNLLRIAQIS